MVCVGNLDALNISSCLATSTLTYHSAILLTSLPLRNSEGPHPTLAGHRWKDGRYVNTRMERYALNSVVIDGANEGAHTLTRFKLTRVLKGG